MTPLVCTPEEFLAATPTERRKLVIAQLDLTPHLHDQGVWRYHPSPSPSKHRCGTTYCAAGWACTLAGDVWVEDGSGSFVRPTRTPGRRVYIPDRAADLLGLTYRQASHAFYDAETRDDVAEALSCR